MYEEIFKWRRLKDGLRTSKLWIYVLKARWCTYTTYHIISLMQISVLSVVIYDGISWAHVEILNIWGWRRETTQLNYLLSYNVSLSFFVNNTNMVIRFMKRSSHTFIKTNFLLNHLQEFTAFNQVETTQDYLSQNSTPQTSFTHLLKIFLSF